MITLLSVVAVALWSSENSAVNREAQARIDAAKDTERAANREAREVERKEEEARAKRHKERAHYLLESPPHFNKYRTPDRKAFIFRESDFQSWAKARTA
jgi:hypothetical protein